MEEGMTVEDIYVRALSSSNLRPLEHRPTDIDVVIAAGAVRESLATSLYRLRAEFDAARAGLKLKLQQAQKDQHHIKTQGLKGFTSTRAALHRFAVQITKRKHWKASQSDPHMLERATDRVLDMVLSPVCDRCNGVRFKLIPGTNRTSDKLCPVCRSTGIRPLRFPPGATGEEVWLTRYLIATLDQKMDHVNTLISRHLQNHHKPRRNPHER